MDKNDIIVPILTAINDLRGEVRENRREIKKNSEEIQRNREAIKQNSEEILKNKEEIQENRKAILEVLYTYEQVTNSQYEENKKRIEVLEEKFRIISA